MNFLTLIVIILAAKLGHIYWKEKKEIQKLQRLNFNILKTDDEIKKTLAIGLYHRFNRDEGLMDGENQTPIEFEDFVADVMRKYYGGDTFVTPPSHDYGVDIEQDRLDGRYLGQVKCYTGSIDFKPIALIHSNMVKQGAKGGFVVTTSNFTTPAQKYNDGLNIELIDGMKLVEYWLQGLEHEVIPPEEQNKNISA